MEFFPDRTHVRLRSREVGTYLYADEDGWGVSLRPHRASLNTAWAVHLLPHMDDTFVLLHTAAYCRYLGVRVDYEAAPQQDHPVGLRMVQCRYDTPQQPDIMWQALNAEDGGGGVRLGQPANQLEPLALHWIVEAIPPRTAPPQLPDQIPGNMQNGVVNPVVLSRMIRYIRADNSGVFILASRGTLQFDGRYLHYLRGDLASQLNDNFNNITLCVRAGFLGRITPLVVDPPLSEETMDIIVLTTGSAAAMELRYPDVDAA